MKFIPPPKRGLRKSLPLAIFLTVSCLVLSRSREKLERRPGEESINPSNLISPRVVQKTVVDGSSLDTLPSQPDDAQHVMTDEDEDDDHVQRVHKNAGNADVLSHNGTKEQESDTHLALEQTADNLSEFIFIPFEEAVEDVILDGWEDNWIANGIFDTNRCKLQEIKIDFVYLWVNGSEPEFAQNKTSYEVKSVLNDPDGMWISSHGVNRYRDWDELKYSIRSVEKHASSFRNSIQIIVNPVPGTEAGKQVPTWLKRNAQTQKKVKIYSQEDIFDKTKHACLPTFNSLTIENQLFNTPSDTDYMFALSDDMLLGKRHEASDIVSPLFGPVMGFKTNAYNTIHMPTDADAQRFGEKPYLIYTSWLLNRRFGSRKRRGQGHFGHALSRSVMKEAIGSFPAPELESACKRFRGEPGFQLYSWFAVFHYVIERHREAMLWSYIMLRSDANRNGYLDWEERKAITAELQAGMKNEGRSSFRKRNFFHLMHISEQVGLKPPVVNTDILWTSQDGPSSIIGLSCAEFDINECLAPGFSVSGDSPFRNPMFSTSLIFDNLRRQKPACGDCLIKLILGQVHSGLSPILPDRKTHAAERDVVLKALKRYRYTISDPEGLFVMVQDAEQIDSSLTSKYVRGKRKLPGQLCLNDDVSTTDERELQDVKTAMTELYAGLFPEKSPFEK